MRKNVKKVATMVALSSMLALSITSTSAMAKKNYGGSNAAIRRDCSRSGHNYTTIINNYKTVKGKKVLVSRYKKCASCGHKERFYP